LLTSTPPTLVFALSLHDALPICIFNSRVRTGTIRAQQIRVPAAAENPEQILLFWSRFFLTQMDPSVPLLMCLPLDENWVDITAGDRKSTRLNSSHEWRSYAVFCF